MAPPIDDDSGLESGWGSASDWGSSLTSALSSAASSPDLVADLADLFKGSMSSAFKWFASEANEQMEIATFLGKGFKKGLSAILPEVPNITQALLQSFTDEAEARLFDKVYNKQKDLIEALAGQNAKAAEQAGNTLSTFAGMSVSTLQNAEYGKKSIMSKAVQDSLDMARETAGHQITLLDGTTRKFSDFSSPQESIKNFTENVLENQRVMKFAAEGMNQAMFENVTIGIKRFGMDAADFRQITERELSATGKVTGEALEKFQKAILVGVEMGIPLRRVSSDLSAMTADFKNFGMISEPQMVSLSNQMHNLGLEISDVTTLAGKFSSFDTAISTMNNLAASTGATLDTMKLFELANTDIEGFVTELRDELDAAGVEFEDMNFIQKKALSSAFGVDPVLMERLLNDNITSVESIVESVTSKADQMTDEEATKRALSLQNIAIDENLQTYREKMADYKNITLDVVSTLDKAHSLLADTVSSGYALSTKSGDSAYKNAQAQHEAVKKLLEETKSLNREMRQMATGTDLTVVPVSPPAASVAVIPTPPVASATSISAGVQNATPAAVTEAPSAPAAPPAPPETPRQPVETIIRFIVPKNVLTLDSIENGVAMIDGNYVRIRVSDA